MMIDLSNIKKEIQKCEEERKKCWEEQSLLNDKLTPLKDEYRSLVGVVQVERKFQNIKDSFHFKKNKKIKLLENELQTMRREESHLSNKINTLGEKIRYLTCAIEYVDVFLDSVDDGARRKVYLNLCNLYKGCGYIEIQGLISQMEKVYPTLEQPTIEKIDQQEVIETNSQTHYSNNSVPLHMSDLVSTPLNTHMIDVRTGGEVYYCDGNYIDAGGNEIPKSYIVD